MTQIPAHGVATRFWAKVRKGPRCWRWIADTNPKGYGRFNAGSEIVLAHRFSWSMVHGNPGSLCVLHRCDVPSCVNPAHLFLGTRADNNRDMCAKGRHARLIGELGPAAKLTDKAVLKLRAEYSSGHIAAARIARRLKMNAACVWRMLVGQTYSHLPIARVGS